MGHSLSKHNPFKISDNTNADFPSKTMGPYERLWHGFFNLTGEENGVVRVLLHRAEMAMGRRFLLSFINLQDKHDFLDEILFKALDRDLDTETAQVGSWLVQKLLESYF